MSYGIVCRQKPKCDNWAAFRFTWPGRDESFVCEDHARKLKTEWLRLRKGKAYNHTVTNVIFDICDAVGTKIRSGGRGNGK